MNPPPKKPISPSVEAPATKILFQPRLTWGDGEITHQGPGFVTSGPNKRPFPVTSSHFLDFTGPALKKAEWLDVNSETVFAVMTNSWGRPGNSASTAPLDLRSDYVIMPIDNDVSPTVILELDDR